MDIYLKQVQGLTMAAKGSSNHWVMMDVIEKLGGNDGAARPMEMLLISLAGCTGMDVVSIVKKKRMQYDRFEMRISSERADEHPKVFTKIHIDYYFFGENVKEESVKRAVELSQEKYCSVSAMLEKSAELTYAYHINEAIPGEEEKEK